jgi:hypothetical protein
MGLTSGKACSGVVIGTRHCAAMYAFVYNVCFDFDGSVCEFCAINFWRKDGSWLPRSLFAVDGGGGGGSGGGETFVAIVTLAADCGCWLLADENRDDKVRPLGQLCILP